MGLAMKSARSESELIRHCAAPSGGKPRRFADTGQRHRLRGGKPPADEPIMAFRKDFRESVSHADFIGGTERDHPVWCEWFTGEKRK